MIVVLGGTGNTGRPIVAELQALGADFRVVSRDPAKAAEALGADVEVVAGDMADPASLAAALDGAERVMLNSGASPTLESDQVNALNAAVDAGVGHIVKLSGNERGMGPDSPAMVLRAHHAIEQAVAASGVPHTFVRPNFFFQNLLNMAPMVAGQGKLIAPVPGNAEIAMLDCRDIGRVAARCLTEDGHAGKAYALHGNVETYGSLAAILSDVLGRDIPHVQPPKEAALQAARERGMPDWMVDHMDKMIDAQAAGFLGGDPSVLHEMLGRPQITLRDFVAHNAAAFGGTG